MSKTVVYEGTAKSPRYEVQWGDRDKQHWSSRGARHISLEAAKAEADKWEREGHDTQIIQLRKEGAK